MAQSTARRLNTLVVRALEQRAAAKRPSAEADHRELLRDALLPDREVFASRVNALRRRLRSSIDSTDVIRAHRDRDRAP